MSRVISCYTNCFGPCGVMAAIEHIREAGISHLELALRPHNFGGLVIPEDAVLTEKSPDAAYHAALDAMQRHGVRISGCNIGGADLRTEDGLQTTIARLRCARRWFGASVAVSGAGQPENAEQSRLVVEHLKRLGEIAQELGMTVAFETHKGPTQNASAMLDLMRTLDHPALRLNFDTGNIAYYNHGLDPVAELRKVINLVANVHLKDNRGGFEDWYFPAIGDAGAVDFAAVRESLDAAGYNGALVIEIEGIGGEPEPGLEARLDRIKRSVAHLSATGYFDSLAG